MGQIRNPGHSKYPKDDCLRHMTNASESLRIKYPSATSCFPDAIHGALWLPGRGRATFYDCFPIQAGAQNKTINYSSVSSQSLQPCNDELFAKGFEAPRMPIVTWCRGCPPGMSFIMLQSVVGASPFEGKNWNGLGFLFFRLGVELHDGEQRTTHLWQAAACFAIARRLLVMRGELASLGMQQITRNIVEVGNLLYYGDIGPTAEEQQGPPEALENWMATLWTNGDAFLSKA